MPRYKSAVLCLCGCFIAIISGYPYDFTDHLQPFENNNSACFGTHTHFKSSCPAGHVIGIQAVKVGAKQTNTNCSSVVDNNYPRNDPCCIPDLKNDCISIYHYIYSGIDFRFHRTCSGYQECKNPIPVPRDNTHCNTSMDYLPTTNYLYMEYACIPKSNIREICINKEYSARDELFYLQSPDYPTKPLYYGISECTCDVHTSEGTGIHVYSLDIRLQNTTEDCEQQLTISDEHGKTDLNCTSATIFNVTRWVLGHNVTITFRNTANFSEGFLWLGFKATNRSSPLQISCSVSYSVPPPVTSSHPLDSTPTPLPFIIAGVGAALFLVLLIIIICCCSKKRQRKVAPRRLDNMPQNTAFSPKTTNAQDNLKHREKEERVQGNLNNRVDPNPLNFLTPLQNKHGLLQSHDDCLTGNETDPKQTSFSDQTTETKNKNSDEGAVFTGVERKHCPLPVISTEEKQFHSKYPDARAETKETNKEKEEHFHNNTAQNYLPSIDNRNNMKHPEPDAINEVGGALCPDTEENQHHRRKKKRKKRKKHKKHQEDFRAVNNFENSEVVVQNNFTAEEKENAHG